MRAIVAALTVAGRYSRPLAVFTVLAAALLPVAPAQAGWCKVAPVWRPVLLYPYAVPVERPCPAEFVPHRRSVHHHYPYVCLSGCSWRAEPWRGRYFTDRAVINITRIVRDRPVVLETKRYVDDPPRIVERRRAVEDEPMMPSGRDRAGQKKRVIHADAEITIIGPDRMTIRLLRKPRAK